MPTPLHDSVQVAVQDYLSDMVFNSNFISPNQFMKLKIKVGTLYRSFVGQYAGQSKEPDLELKVRGRIPAPNLPAHCPIWVNETGYS